MKRTVLAACAALLLSGTSAFAGPFDGMSPEELFPGAASAQERDTAYKALMAANLPDARDRFAGKQITIGVLAGGPRGGISGPVFFWRNAFEKVTGAKLDIVELPFSGFLTSTVADFATGQNTYDVLTPGAWFYGDYMKGNWIAPIDKYFTDPAYPQWNRDAIAPAIRKLMMWDGKWYGALNDGDTQLLYYRKDILTDPKWKAAFKEETGKDLPDRPSTWQDLLEITKFFNEKDWNGDGDPDDGISMHLKGGGFGFFHFMSLAASFAIEPSPGDDPTKRTDQYNAFWFSPKDMKPLINAPGQVAALEYLQELAKTGSPSQVSWDLSEAWNDFLSGNAVAMFSFGDVGSLAEDPGASKIRGKLGSVRLPCSTTWYSTAEAKMKTDVERPNCVGNTTGGSWHGVISATSKEPDLSYYLISMMASPEINFWNVAYGWTGVDASSTLHFLPPRGEAKVEDYVATGYDAGDAKEFIDAYGENLFSYPTMQDFLRIPGTPAYWEALDTHLAKVMSGQASAKDALDATAEEWETITDDLGRDEQLELYHASINYQAH